MKKTVNFKMLCIICTVISFASCGPYHEQKYVDVKPNETAFVIPMEQGTETNQKQLHSIAYLEKNKVAAKRIYINTIQHDVGRGPGNYIWIPTDTVVIVDRTPITREWTKDAATGTSNKNERVEVESRNSIGFTVGINCTASIPEEDAAKSLYYFPQKTLAQVMDNNVRGYVLTVLTREFGHRQLTECQNERSVVFDTLSARTTKFFAEFGVRIENIGAAGEFEYVEPEIQTAINLQFVAEKKNDAATNEVNAANKFAAAAASIKAQKELDVDITIKNAFAEALKNGKLTWPTTLVVDKNMSLMDLYGVSNLNK